MHERIPHTSMAFRHFEVSAAVHVDIETIDLNLQEAAEYCMNKEIDVFVCKHWFGWA